MYRKLIVALSICTASPVLAEEVLYCTDTAATGFGWTDSGAQSYPFRKDRYTIKVMSDTDLANRVTVERLYRVHGLP
jgi:hypothetical protein